MRKPERLTALLLVLALLISFLPQWGYALEAEPEESAIVEPEETLPEAEEPETEDAPTTDEAASEPPQEAALPEAETQQSPDIGDEAQVLSVETTLESPLEEILLYPEAEEEQASQDAALALLPELTYHTSQQALATELREHMRKREECFQVGYCAPELLISGSTEAQQKIALKKWIIAHTEAHTGVPTEGDYLKWQNDGFRASLSVEKLEGLYYHTITITPYHAKLWYTTAAQEAQVDERIAALRQSLFSEGMNDREKIRAAYDYITRNVSYENNYAQREQQGDYLPFTCYGALIEGKAVCQGYALLFYRLMLEEGIDCRVIAGYDLNYTYHAWNIVRLGDVYWNMDATWDAGKTAYQYYLRCEACFADHIRDNDKDRNSVYDDEAFYAAYPMGTDDLPLAAPVIIGAEGSTLGLRLCWRGQEGAARYRIWQWTDSEWTSLTTTDETELVLPGISAGENYTIAVSCADETGEALSHRSTTVSGSYELLDAPQLQAAVEYSGVRLRWTSQSDGLRLRVFRKEGGTITQVGDTTGNTLLVTGLTSGKTYTFFGQYMTPDGAYAAGPRGEQGTSVRFFSAPALQGASIVKDGIQVRWSPVSGVNCYRVYYKMTGESKWSLAGSTSDTAFVLRGPKSGESGIYTVRCASKDGKTNLSGFDARGSAFQYWATPVLTKAVNVVDGVQLSWSKVSGAERYRVVYRSGGGSWKTSGTTNRTTYTVTGLASGTGYTFAVQCIGADGIHFPGLRSAGKTLRYLSAPVLSDVHADNQGVVLRWNAVKGAVNYRVFYQSAGKWISAGTSVQTSYTVRGLQTGKAYRFTVRCISADGKQYTSAYRGDNPPFSYLPIPSISSASCVKGGIRVQWKAVTGTRRYRVYYRTQGGSWNRAGDTADTSLLVSGLKSGVVYEFTLRCIGADGKFASGYRTAGTTLLYLDAPVLRSATAGSGSVTLRWNSVSGARRYRVFYRYEGGAWKSAGSTSSTSFVVKNLTRGASCCFTVRCISADGRQYTSGYDAKGLCATPR